MSGLVESMSPIARRVRAYCAPVNRATGAPTLFDASTMGSFLLDGPPAPWTDLGWCTGFVRRSGTKIEPVITGSPGLVSEQVRTEVAATVSLEFESWGKLQLALAAGVQQMNVLQAASGSSANGSGGVAVAASALAADSTATTLDVGTTAASGFAVGGLVAVDIDYNGQVGFVGSGISGGYVASALSGGGDVDYIRRVTLNVGRIVTIANGVLTLGSALPAGLPTGGMKVSPVVGFCDREGDGFFQEWSALFIAEGSQGDRALFHYPRLQTAEGIAEKTDLLAGDLERMRLASVLRALPVVDATDGQRVVCFRSYLPGAMRTV